MKTILPLLALSLALLACGGGTGPGAPDASSPDDSAALADGATADAASLADGGTVDLDAPGEVVDAFAEQDAALETLDGGAVSRAVACRTVEDAWAATGCSPELWACVLTADEVAYSRVEACTVAIAAAYADDSGSGTTALRCMRAMAANAGCFG